MLTFVLFAAVYVVASVCAVCFFARQYLQLWTEFATPGPDARGIGAGLRQLMLVVGDIAILAAAACALIWLLVVWPFFS